MYDQTIHISCGDRAETEQKEYYYTSTIRYCPDLMTDEFLNIGVVLIRLGRPQIGVCLNLDPTRIVSTFHQVNELFFQRTMYRMAECVKAMNVTLSSSESLTGEQASHTLVRLWTESANITLSEYSVGYFVDHPDTVLTRTYKRKVLWYLPAKTAKQKTTLEHVELVVDSLTLPSGVGVLVRPSPYGDVAAVSVYPSAKAPYNVPITWSSNACNKVDKTTVNVLFHYSEEVGSSKERASIIETGELITTLLQEELPT